MKDDRIKILLLGDINSIHLQKWIDALKKDFRLAVFSLDPISDPGKHTNLLSGIELYTNKTKTTMLKSKLAYLCSLNKVRSIYKTFQPDITHAHYATSYGLLGRLTSPKKLAVSVWGSDVYIFPKKSWLNRQIFLFIQKGTDCFFSTSIDLTIELKKYTNKHVKLIPYGFDPELFKPSKKEPNKQFIIGTVKGLRNVYGIDRLIKAFAVFHQVNPQSECWIYGQGELKDKLINLAQDLDVAKSVKFLGFIPHDSVADALNQFDVYCALSRSESFGVAVLEASACEIPVVVSNVGGLPEVVNHQITGYVIEPTIDNIVEKLNLLIKDEKKRNELGKAGREFVLKNYVWSQNVKEMIKAYHQLIENEK